MKKTRTRTEIKLLAHGIQNLKFKILNAVLLAGLFLGTSEVIAQSSNSESPSPRGALLRSLVVPGWGHHYVDKTNWNRGKVHFGGEVLSILSLFGLNVHINQLETSLQTLARSKAGTSLKGQGRAYEIAISNFNSLAEYNDYQLRSRNWDKLITDTPENRWSWQSEQDRLRFADTRSRISGSENQYPVIISVMVANRLFSGINAFQRARDRQGIPQVSLRYQPDPVQSGITAHMRIEF